METHRLVVLWLLAGVSYTLAADEQITCQSDDGSCQSRSNSLLQVKRSQNKVSISTAEQGLHASWSCSPFSDCIDNKQCGDGTPRQIRECKCKDVLTGNDADGACDKLPKPSSSKSCKCEAMACKQDNRCAEEGGDDNSQPHFENLGCFDVPDVTVSDNMKHGLDMNCVTSDAVPCNAGLAFYHVKVNDEQECQHFCLEKGLDIAGFSKSTCRCGATKINLEMFHEHETRPGIIFDGNGLKPAKDGCPASLFRFTGPFENGGVPFRFSNFNEDDLQYTDSMASGKKIGEGEEEDGISEHEMKTGLPDGVEEESLLQDPPGWERHCVGGKCGPGSGPWQTKTADKPPHVQSATTFNEYTTVDYVFEADVDDGRKDAFREAVKMWAETTCVVLLEKASVNTAHIKVGIYDVGSCWLSGMGWPGPTGSSKINLGWCADMRHKGNMAHEIGHALGMNHEQKRPDGAFNYHGIGPKLILYWDNIPDRWKPQYLPDESSYVGSANDGQGDAFQGYAPYDFGSIMHYGGGSRYDTDPPSGEQLTGNRAHLSQGDIDQMNDMYGCNFKSGPTPAPTPPAQTPAPTPPPTFAAGPPADCGFEDMDADKTFCGSWKNLADTDDFDWTPRSGGTPSGSTGPTGASEGSNYVFIESSAPRAAGDKAVLISKPLILNTQVTMNFDYSMVGAGIGALEIFADDQSIWRREGASPDNWQTGSVDLPTGASVTLRIVGTRGSSWQGDIAVDNIVFGASGVVAPTTQAPTSPPTTQAPTSPPTTQPPSTTPWVPPATTQQPSTTPWVPPATTQQPSTTPWAPPPTTQAPVMPIAGPPGPPGPPGPAGPAGQPR